MAKDLQEIRVEIDGVDRELIRLFEKRMELAKEVALYKKETGKPILDEKREAEKLDAVAALATTEYNQKAVRQLFMEIMSISRAYQKLVIEQ